MNTKIITVLVILMMSLVIIPATSKPIKMIEPIEKIRPQQQILKVMIFCVIEISGEGQIWSLPGVLAWRIDSGSIKITYLGGVYNATSGKGMFIFHLGTKTENPVSIGGVSPIGIIFNV